MITDLLAPYKAWLLVGLSALVISVVGWYIIRAEKAVGRVEKLELQLKIAEAETKKNEDAVEDCKATNQANENEAARQRGRAEAAEKAVQQQAAEFDQREEVLEDEAQRLRAGGLGCPAINADFRDWLRSD